jgi:hypothetical protein
MSVRADFENAKPMAAFASVIWGLLAVSERGDHVALFILMSAILATMASWVGTED